MIENAIFKALADPTRRAIFEKLAGGSMTASALRKGMDISQPACGPSILASEPRRRILNHLATGPMTVGEIAQHFDMALPSISKHLSVLKEAGLVREQKQGRYVNYEVDSDGLMQIARWLSKYRAYWPTRAKVLNSLLKDMEP